MNLFSQDIFLKQLPFNFFKVHWDYINNNATKCFRKITVYKLNNLLLLLYVR